MTDDIVTRLRFDVDGVIYMPGIEEPTGMIVWEAADEIERLRADIEQRAKLMSQIVQLLVPFSMLMSKHEQELLIKAVRGE